MVKKNTNHRNVETKPNLLWRKPISLESFDEDPLAELYRGREVEQINVIAESGEKTADDKEKSERIIKTISTSGTTKQSPKKQENAEKKPVAENVYKSTAEINEAQPDGNPTLKISDTELKEILKIKDDFFHFTDVREVLRGKSFDIYAHLRFLAGEEGFCKIKHLDLMDAVNVSRPTLFKQQVWLIKLSLIEKRSVPGDHLGTSYTVRRLEDVLPLPEAVIGQIENHIESLHQAID